MYGEEQATIANDENDWFDAATEGTGGQEQPNTAGAPPTISSLETLHLPQFWASKARLWFTSVEAQFNSRRITADLTKYNAIVARLDLETISVVEHIVENPPATDKYQALKDALLNHYSVSQEVQYKKLVSGLELGHKRPSEFLTEMTKLGGNQLNENFLRTLWTDRLPQQVQFALAAADGLNNSALAQLADKVMEIQRNTMPGHVMAVTQTQANNALEQKVQELTKQVQALTKKVDQLTLASKGKGRSRSATPRPPNNSNGATSEYPTVCYYHRRFGKNSTKCTTPCGWKPEQGNDNDR